MEETLSQILSGFSKLSRKLRLDRLVQVGRLTPSDADYLMGGPHLDVGMAENFIENVIGYMHIPLGIATNFVVDGKEIVIPMAVEETSIVAAASKTAKWVREMGSIETRLLGREIIGQIQIGSSLKPLKTRDLILSRKTELLATANEIASGLVRRGGGCKDLQVRLIDREDGTGAVMVVTHILCDPCDAMGANIINQVCEALKGPIQVLTGEKVTMCILSNLVDTRLTEAKVVLKNIEPSLASRIAEGSLFGELDPYRAATNNKGVLNGIDAVLVATGNDWRAVEAGVHAYAAQTGRYKSVTQWRAEGSTLTGTLVAPLVVGTVGGVTTLHPTARMNMRLLGVETAEQLSRILGAVGLVQNLGALRALTTVGVVEGHMKLHAANLALAAGAQPEEMKSVQALLEVFLKRERRVSLQNAVEVLEQVRSRQSVAHETLHPE